VGYAFGGLDASQVARLDAVVAQAAQAAAQAQALVDSTSSTWSSIIGADSSYNAMVTDAKASATLRDTLQAKRDRLVSDPNASEADVMVMEGATSSLGNEALTAASKQLSISEALRETAKPPKLTDIPWWAWAAGGIVVLAVVSPYINRGRR
jgi:hypothetical protein